MIAMLPNIPTAKGDMVAGKYRVERVIHASGRSVVMEATHMELGTRVVLRLPGPTYAQLHENLSGFRDATRHAALLRGNRAERLTDSGALETGEPFMTTEHLEGIDLATELHLGGALRAEDAVDFALQACEALADAHALGILHCDLRPGKLFVSIRDEAPFVTVLISIISVFPDARTRYHFDHRADIFTLGVTLGELLAGKPLFSYVETPPSPSGRVMTSREYASLRITRPDLPPDLVSLVEKAFSEDPSNRYDSMASFALALARFAPPRSRPVLDRIARKAVQPGQ
jgi:serine/threonine protein kinase